MNKVPFSQYTINIRKLHLIDGNYRVEATAEDQKTRGEIQHFHGSKFQTNYRFEAI